MLHPPWLEEWIFAKKEGLVDHFTSPEIDDDQASNALIS